MGQLDGKVAVVIGGSKGLGYGIAQGFAAEGATVVLASRGMEELQKKADEINAGKAGRAIPIKVDITSVQAIRDFVQEAVKQAGRIDILVNSAGINIRKYAIDFEENDWDAVMNVQSKYVFFMCQTVARYWVDKGIKGRIINMASLTTFSGFKRMVAYGCAKAGIAQITKSLANEWAQYGINVNALAPGYYLTEMTKPLFSDPEIVKSYLEKIPKGRMGEPGDLAGAAVLLAGPGGEYITGITLPVDGGWLVD